MINRHIQQLLQLLENNNNLIHNMITQSPQKAPQPIPGTSSTPVQQTTVENVAPVSQKVDAKPVVSSNSQRAVEFAHSRIGTPYVYGGTTDAGYDCSGFVQAAYRNAGVNIPRTTYEQAVYGRSVSRAELQPGDLIFYGNGGPSTSYHVAMYIGNGQVIHSPQSGDRVKQAPMDMMRISAMQRPA